MSNNLVSIWPTFRAAVATNLEELRAVPDAALQARLRGQIERAGGCMNRLLLGASGVNSRAARDFDGDLALKAWVRFRNDEGIRGKSRQASSSRLRRKDLWLAVIPRQLGHVGADQVHTSRLVKRALPKVARQRHRVP